MSRRKEAAPVSLDVGGIAVELEPVDLADLQPDNRNAMRHGPRGIGEVGDSLQSVGPGRSLVTRGNRIVCGNGTQEAALERGFRQGVRVKLPPGVFLVNDRSDLSEAKATEMGLRDNKSARSPDTVFDAPMVMLLAAEYELSLPEMGFQPGELDGPMEPEPTPPKPPAGGCKRCPEHCG